VLSEPHKVRLTRYFAWRIVKALLNGPELRACIAHGIGRLFAMEYEVRALCHSSVAPNEEKNLDPSQIRIRVFL